MGLEFEGKVVFITGAARGQGRSHAVRFAEEGADIIALDLCDQIDSVAYPMGQPEDLEETVRLVEKTGRRIVAEQGDVRDFERLQAVVSSGVAELGRLDYVIASAGILTAFGEHSNELTAYSDSIDVMLNGVYLTIEAALPAILDHGEGGAIVITSSVAGLTSFGGFKAHGLAGYVAAKHGVVGLMRYFACALAEHGIRVNAVHPTGVATPMIMNEPVEQLLSENPAVAGGLANLLPVPLVEPIDISEAMLYLCGRSGRYITGISLPVDAGFLIK